MKKLISILVVAFIALSVTAQVTSRSGELKTLKSFRLGNCKLVEVTKAETVTYQITATCVNATSYKMDLQLGNAKQAVQLLESLSTYKPSNSNEVVDLNNPGFNTARFEKLGGVWRIYSDGKQFEISVTRKELSTMAKTLRDHGNIQ